MWGFLSNVAVVLGWRLRHMLRISVRFPIAFDVGPPSLRRRRVWLVRGGGMGVLHTHSTVLFMLQLGVRVASRGRGGVRVCVRVPRPVQSSLPEEHLTRSGPGPVGGGAGW